MSKIWRESDRTTVAVSEATMEWSLRAHEILEEVARRYNRSLAYDDLATEVQRRTGIHTDIGVGTWLDDVLAEVGTRCSQAGEPRLISLVDRPGASRPDQVSAERLACYEAYGAKVPSTTSRTRTTTSKRAAADRAPARPKARAAEPRPRPICPTCYMELPSTGICDNCS